MTEAKLTKTVAVLTASPGPAGGKHFILQDDDLEADRRLIISTDLWRELGSPDEVTVTIVPGDQLNPSP